MVITSKSNPLIKDIIKLSGDRKYRRAAGLFVVEGLKPVTEFSRVADYRVGYTKLVSGHIAQRALIKIEHGADSAAYCKFILSRCGVV